MLKRLFILSCLAIFLISCSNESKKKDENSSVIQSKQEDLGLKIKHDLSLKLNNNTSFDFAFLKDDLLSLPSKRPVMFVFFTTSCLPCNAQINVLNVLAKEYKSLQIIGVLLEANVSQTDLLDFIKKQNVKYLLANGEDNFAFAKNLGSILEIPSLYLYSSSGKLLRSYTGLMPLEMLRTAMRGFNIAKK